MMIDDTFLMEVNSYKRAFALRNFRLVQLVQLKQAALWLFSTLCLFVLV